MNPTLPTRVEISPDALFQELEGETVLLNLKSERYYGLDDVGNRMWQVLAEDGDVAAACAKLLAEYDVEADRLRDDLATLIARLAEAGLLTITTPETHSPSDPPPAPERRLTLNRMITPTRVRRA